MNEILVNNIVMPKVIETGFYTAASPFYHMNRTAKFHVLLLVVEGVIYVTEKNVDYAIGPGEVFFLKAGINHFGRFEIPKGTRWYFIHFELSQKFKKSNYKFFQLPKKINKNLGNKIETMTHKIVDDFHSTDSLILMKTNCNLFELLLEIFDSANGKKIENNLSDKICEFLEQHVCEDFCIKDLEDEFCLSYKRLAAIFKNQKNINMKKYHTEQKIKFACRLMQTSLKNLSEISLECGFSDPLYFSKVFKQFTGKSPSQWRKSVCY